MIDFLDLFEKQRQKEEDNIYFSKAYDDKGRRYSQEYVTELDTVSKGGFGFLRLSRLKSNNSSKTYMTKVISKEDLFAWQVADKNLVEADILSNINHDNIVKVCPCHYEV